MRRYCLQATSWQAPSAPNRFDLHHPPSFVITLRRCSLTSASLLQTYRDFGRGRGFRIVTWTLCITALITISNLSVLAVSLPALNYVHGIRTSPVTPCHITSHD